MIVLFSPSENKNFGGIDNKFDLANLIFPNLKEKRGEIWHLYNEFLCNASKEQLSKLFGIKNEKEVEKYLNESRQNSVMKAVLRYSGVAYDYLDYRSLDDESKEFIDKNVIIFSNLFGMVMAGDLIPFYKIKQGESFTGFKIENFYRQNFSPAIDELLKDEDILDLRAGFYDKFYTPRKKYTTVKFLKNSKSVSHFAKAYRGLFLRHIAKAKISSVSQLANLQISGIKINSIIDTKLYTQFIFDTVDF